MSDLLGVCIAIGDGWPEVGALAAARMQRMTGVECVVVTQEFCSCIHPSWLKAKVIDAFPHDAFLVFDADLWCLKPWSPQQWFTDMGRPFMAVPDTRLQDVYSECEELGLPFPDTYLNGGLTIFGREHKPVWDYVWAKHPRCGRWLEQGALNLALLELAPQVCRLPRRFNWVTHKGNITHDTLDKEGIVNLHLTGCSSASEVSALQQRFL